MSGPATQFPSAGDDPAQRQANQETAMQPTSTTQASAHYEIRFQSLFREGRALSFPCDREGRVDLDKVNDRLRNSYLFARAMLGREYAMPVVRECDLH
jgi:hypothetical protein